MFLQIFPDGYGVLVIAVESPVDELYLFDFVVQEELKFLLNDSHVPQAHPPFYGGQAVAAAVRAAAAGLVIENLVLERLQVVVEERNAVHVRQGAVRGVACRQAQARDFL